MRVDLAVSTVRLHLSLLPSFFHPPLKTSHEALLLAVCLPLSFIYFCPVTQFFSPLAVPPPAASDISDILQQEENPILNVNYIQTNES